jgi:glycine/D-amino acid oxidase-like deaminating enzyme
MNETVDVVIAGGAVIGSSVAFHLGLLSQGRCRVLVVEPDPTYARAASALSASSIRQQFSQPVNIKVSLAGIAFLRAVGDLLAVDGERPDIGLKEGGYLYIAPPDGAATLAELNALQRGEGADILLLDRDGLAARFPWLTTGDLAAGNWGRSGEGWFDGYGLTMAFRRKARSLGVGYRKARVVEVERAAGRVVAVTLDDGGRIACGVLVNAAGASGARALAARTGFDVPVVARKRSVFGFTCPDRLTGFPLLIDTSGVWVRPEGEGYICGWSAPDSDEDQGADFEVDWPEFEDVVWPALANRVPAFERLRPGRAWAGHYDMNMLDHNALVGRVPGLANAFLAAGFSGHGIQQAPAVGRGLAELILDGRFTRLDLSDLACDRLVSGRRLLERNVI